MTPEARAIFTTLRAKLDAMPKPGHRTKSDREEIKKLREQIRPMYAGMWEERRANLRVRRQRSQTAKKVERGGSDGP